MNHRFGITFSLFRHDEANVNELFAGMETQTNSQYGEKLLGRKVQHPSVDGLSFKCEIKYEPDSPSRKVLIAEAVYDCLTYSARRSAQEK